MIQTNIRLFIRCTIFCFQMSFLLQYIYFRYTCLFVPQRSHLVLFVNKNIRNKITILELDYLKRSLQIIRQDRRMTDSKYMEIDRHSVANSQKLWKPYIKLIGACQIHDGRQMAKKWRSPGKKYRIHLPQNRRHKEIWNREI